MTYKHYILKNRIKDSKEAFRAYVEKHHTLYKAMNPAMQKQYVDGNYPYRFCDPVRLWG